MSSKEVTELRKAGKLEEAYQMAKQLLEAEPDNVWNKRAISWVYYEYLKKYASLETYNEFKKSLLKIKELNLSEEEKMIFDSAAWQIGKVVFSLQQLEPVEYNKIDELFEIIKGFHFTKPSEGYSFVYKSFHKGYHNWSKYLEFADWWDFENFMSEDYLETEYKGMKIMVMAEQAYIAYSKKILEGTTYDVLKIQKIVDKEKAKSFLPKLDVVINEHPEYQYPPYFKVKLLLAAGSDKDVLPAFLPFAKQKRNDFWVWELMAEIFADDKELQFACYCKALSCKAPEDFLVKLRQTFAEILVERRMYNEAKTEIDKVATIREVHGWKLPHQIKEWLEQEWYKNATSKRDNKEIYKQHAGNAEEILFQDIPEEVVVIEFVNKNKRILYFVKDKSKFGFFNYHKLIDQPKIGNIVKVRFNREGDNGYHEVLTARKMDESTESDAIKKVEGSLKVISPHNFGFIDDVYVHSTVIQKNNLKDGQDVKGKAILSFDKKKEKWGWKAIALN